VNIVEKSLEVALDVNHMMDLLGVLTKIGYGTNIIEVLEKASRPYENHRLFLKREYQLSHF